MKNKSDSFRRPTVRGEGEEGTGASPEAVAGSEVGGHTSGEATAHSDTNPAYVRGSIEPDHDSDLPPSPPENFFK